MLADGLLRKLRRDVWRERARFALATLALWVGLVAGGALLDAWAWMKVLSEEHYAASLPVHATLRLDRVDATALEIARAHAEIATVRASAHVGASLENGTRRLRALVIAYPDFRQDDIGRLIHERGPWPPAAGVYVERSSLEFSGIEVGQTLALRIGDGAPAALPVVGVVRDVAQAPGWMEHLVYVYADPTTLAQQGVAAVPSELQLRVRAAAPTRADVRRAAASLATELTARGYRVRSVDVPEPGEHVHAAQMNSLFITQAAFAVLTLVACALIVFDLFGAILAGHVREIAILKTLGAPHGTIAAAYGVLAFALGSVAALLAVVPAWWIGRAYARMRVEMLNMPFDAAALPPWVLLVEVAAGGTIALLAAAAPIRRGCERPVVDALRADLRASDTAVRLPAGPMPPLLRLALQYALRRRARSLLTIAAIAVGLSVGLAAGNLERGVRASVDRLFASQRYDVVLALPGASDVARIETIARGTPGIAAMEAWPRARAVAALPDALDSDAFDVVGVPATSTLLAPQVSIGRWLDDRARDEVVVSHALLRREPTLASAGTLRLRIGAAWTERRIVGVVDTGTQPVAYVRRDELQGARAMQLVARVPGDAAAELAAIAALREAFTAAGQAVGDSARMRESRRVVEDHLLMVVQFLGMASWLLLATGALGLATALASAVLERRRELAVLRAIGARHGDVRRLVVFEALALATVAWLLALVLSVPMSVALGESFARVMFAVPVRWVPTLQGSVQWGLAAAVTALAASIVPVRAALRVPAARVLSAVG